MKICLPIGHNMRITQKGQVTIPQEIREQFGLLPHTEVQFVVKNNKVILQKALSMAERIAALRGCHRGRYTTDELMKITRGEDYFD